MRTLEALMTRPLREQLPVERLFAVRADDFGSLGGGLAHAIEASSDRVPPVEGSTPCAGSPITRVGPAAMRLDPNTHAFVMATAFLTSICFAIAAMQVIALAIHLFVPGAG